MTYRVLDLFSGIGGFSLGLERTGGFETVAFCEIDPFCRKVLAKHWPDVPCHDDIETRQFTKGEADVVTGGFPCQDISFAGRGAGLAGERSGLYRHLIRAIRVVRPKYAIIENVAALLNRGLGVVLGDLAAIGYDAEWHCIPASAVGAPHRRDRVWIIAHSDGFRSGKIGTFAQSSSIWKDADDARPICRNATERDASNPPPLFGPSLVWNEPNGNHAGIGDVADSKCGRFQGGIFRHSVQKAIFPATLCRKGGRNDQWRIESDVGRVAHGSAPRMDEGGLDETRISAEESRAESGFVGRQGLRGLRFDASPTAPSSRLFEANRSPNSLPEVPCGSGPTGRPSSEEADEAVQNLRPTVLAKSQQKTYDMRSRLSFGAWPHERDETLGIWEEEPDVPRVAHGVANRVNRLRALGNGIVPQIAELIGNAILNSERRAA